jgi:hypothetical protein
VAQKPRPFDNVFTLFSDDAELAEEASFGGRSFAIHRPRRQTPFNL